MTEETVDITESLVRMLTVTTSLVVIFTCTFLFPFVQPQITDQSEVVIYPDYFWIIWTVLFVPFFILAVASYFISPLLITRNLKLLPASENSKVFRLVKGLSQKLGLPKSPSVLIHNSEEPNCFIFGKTAKEAKLIISEGMIHLLNDEELKAAILHELSHIRNKDMAFMTWAVSFKKALKYWFLILLGGILLLQLKMGTIRANEIGVYTYGTISSLIVFFIIPILAINSVSRVRELLADARTTIIMKNTLPLVSAIKKTLKHLILINLIRGRRRPKISAVAKLASFNPLPYSLLKYTFLTHPSLKERLNSLINRRYVIKRNQMYLPSLEASFYAGLLTVYIINGGMYLWIFFLPEIMNLDPIAKLVVGLLFEMIVVFLMPSLIIFLVNCYPTRHCEIRLTRSNVDFYIKGLLSRNLTSSATLLIFLLLLPVLSSPQGIKIIAVIWYTVLLFLISSLFSLCYLLIRARRRKNDKIKGLLFFKQQF